MWLRIDDNFTQHPKIVHLPARDRWTWMEVLCYCARYRTSGFFPRRVGDVLPGVTPAFVKRCLELGLIKETETGYRVRGGRNSHDRRQLWEQFGGICYLCNQPVPYDDFHVEHVVPLARGGLDEWENLNIGHPACNLRKGTSLLSEIEWVSP